MTELRPLLTRDPANAYVRLLGSAELDVPPREGRARLLARLGVQAAGVLGAGTAAAATSGAAGLSVISKWIAIGMMTGFATTGSLHLLEQKAQGSAGEREAMPAAAIVPVEKRSLLQSPAPRSERASEQAPAREEGAAKAPPRQRPAAPVPRPAAEPRSEAKPKATLAATLADEVAALDAARRALQAHDANRALGMLDAHERRFEQPRLAPEATLLRIETLALAGRRDEARRLAQRLLSVKPDTPHAERVRAILRDLASER
jgi:hypothetical protein